MNNIIESDWIKRLIDKKILKTIKLLAEKENKMLNTVYLVGQISTQIEETYRWRERVVDYFKENEEFYIINPCGNSFNQKVGNDKIKLKEVYGVKGIEILVPKDKYYVTNSNIILADLRVHDPEKLIIGSIFELAWAIESPETTIVGINGDPQICNHPFIKSAVTCWVDDEMEGCELINHYYRTV